MTLDVSSNPTVTARKTPVYQGFFHTRRGSRPHAAHIFRLVERRGSCCALSGVKSLVEKRPNFGTP